MDEALRSVADYGLAIVGVVTFAVALWWINNQYINSLKASRDEALQGWKDQTKATDKLADKLAEVEQRLDDLYRERGR